MIDQFDEVEFLEKMGHLKSDDSILHSYIQLLNEKGKLQLLTQQQFRAKIESNYKYDDASLLQKFQTWLTVNIEKIRDKGQVENIRFPWIKDSFNKSQCFPSMKVEGFCVSLGITTKKAEKSNVKQPEKKAHSQNLLGQYQKQHENQFEDEEEQQYFLQQNYAATKNKMNRKISYMKGTQENLRQQHLEGLKINLQGNVFEIPGFCLAEHAAMSFLLAIELPNIYKDELTATQETLKNHLADQTLHQVYKPFLKMYQQYKSIIEIKSFQEEHFNFNDTVHDFKKSQNGQRIQNFNYVAFWSAIKKQAKKSPQISENQISNALESGIDILKVVYIPRKQIYGATLRNVICINSGINYSTLFKHRQAPQFKELVKVYFFVTAIHELTHYLLREIKLLNVCHLGDNSFDNEILHSGINEPSFGVKIYQILVEFYWNAYTNDKNFFNQLKENNEEEIKYEIEDITQNVSVQSDVINQIIQKYQENQSFFDEIQAFQNLSKILHQDKIVFINCCSKMLNLVKSQKFQAHNQQIQDFKSANSNYANEKIQTDVKFFKLLFTSNLTYFLLSVEEYDEKIIQKLLELKVSLENGQKTLTKEIIHDSNLSRFYHNFQKEPLLVSMIKELFRSQKVRQISEMSRNPNALKDYYLRQYEKLKSIAKQFSSICPKFSHQHIKNQNVSFSSVLKQFVNLAKKFKIKINNLSNDIGHLFLMIQLKELYAVSQKCQKYKDLIQIYKEFPEIMTHGKKLTLEAGQYMEHKLFPKFSVSIYHTDYKFISFLGGWNQIGTMPEFEESRKWNLKIAVRDGTGKVVPESLYVGGRYCWFYYNRYILPFEKHGN